MIHRFRQFILKKTEEEKIQIHHPAVVVVNLIQQTEMFCINKVLKSILFYHTSTTMCD